jgi:hypothetical protein
MTSTGSKPPELHGSSSTANEIDLGSGVKKLLVLAKGSSDIFHKNTEEKKEGKKEGEISEREREREREERK